MEVTQIQAVEEEQEVPALEAVVVEVVVVLENPYSLQKVKMAVVDQIQTDKSLKLDPLAKEVVEELNLVVKNQEGEEEEVVVVVVAVEEEEEEAAFVLVDKVRHFLKTVHCNCPYFHFGQKYYVTKKKY